MRERVLDPLALSSTVWSAGDLPPERIATGYRPAGDGFTAEVPLADGGDFAALGGLYSTVRDLARWSGVFLDAEPPRDAPERAPVSRATLREMQRARSAFAPGVEWPSLAEPPGVIAGGYGYGLMIWHERDGQRHVGHPGGLPGYGTLMRWVPELGLSAILLANVTYAKCELPLRRALRWSRARPRCRGASIRADPGLLAARDAVDGLVARWDDGAAARLFTPNVDLDQPLAERRAELEQLRERHGALARDGEFEPEDALRGRWRLRGERGHVDLDITMAPTVPPLVQTLGFESVLPPAGLLATLATAAVDVVARAAPRGARRAALARARRRRGAARLPGGRRALRPVRRPRAGRGRRRDGDDAAPAERARRRRPRARARRRERAPRSRRAAPRELGGSVRAIFASSVRGSDESRTVTPLELFFDLVFVFAVSQLTHLLVAHFDARGAIETLILTLAVVYAWYMTAWVSNWMSPGQPPVQALLLAIMLLSLLMSSGIDGAFSDHGWLFVIPYVVIQVGRAAFATVTFAPGSNQHIHFVNVLLWELAITVLWIAGALADGDARIALWALAVLALHAGVALFHAIPGRPSTTSARRSGRTRAACTAMSRASTCSSGCGCSS